MEYKVIAGDAQIKVAGDGPGRIMGYASTWANWDRAGERPVKGAFDPHLAAFLRDGFITASHDWNALAIASPDVAREDSIGLYFEAAFHSTAAAQDARIVAQERQARGMTVKSSIGYEVLADKYVPRDDGVEGQGRLLLDVPLFEIAALVNVPMNPRALITGVKSNPASRLPYDAEAGQVESAVRALLTRTQARAAIRAKDGRVLSAANRGKLASLETSLSELLQIVQDLLTASEPPDKEKAGAAWRRAQLDFYRLQATARALRAGE